MVARSTSRIIQAVSADEDKDQPNRSAMERAHPGGISFLIKVTLEPSLISRFCNQSKLTSPKHWLEFNFKQNLVQ